MKNRLVLFGTLFIVFAWANPYVATLINEFGTDGPYGPWVELHPRPFFRDLDMDGWVIATSTSCCTLNCEISSWDPYIVISDSTRGEYWHGTFELNPVADSILVWNTTNQNWPDSERICYPDTPPWWRGAPVPPPGASSALWNYDAYEDQSINWYVDSTPTPGEENDDYSTISGSVRGSGGQVPDYVTIYCRGPNGSCHGETYQSAAYHVDGLGPGTYEAKAVAKFGSTYHTVYYPESVAVGYSEERTGINITIPMSGVAAPSQADLEFELLVGNGVIAVVCPELTDADLSLVDPLGRQAAVLHRGTLSAGRHRFALPSSLRAGPYFALMRWPGGQRCGKLVKVE